MSAAPPSVLVEALAPHLRAPLISPAAWRRIQAHVARLPPVFSWGIFECRLAGAAPDGERVDMLWCIERRGGGAAALGAAELDGAALAPVAGFLRAWRDAGDTKSYDTKPYDTMPHDRTPHDTMPHDTKSYDRTPHDTKSPLAAVPLVWIEHDLLPSGPSPPFVQLCIDPGYRGAPGQPPLAPAAARTLAAAGVATLIGEAEAALDCLQRCATRLPPGGRLVHVGVIPHRGSRDLRLLAALPFAHALPWLDAIGWPGERAHAAELLALLGDRFSHASVQLDLGPAPRPTLALEFPLLAPADDAEWTRFTTALVARGLADADKTRAALAWIGGATHDLPGLPWTVHVQRQLDVKLVLDGSGALVAKAYLAFHPRFVLA